LDDPDVAELFPTFGFRGGTVAGQRGAGGAVGHGAIDLSDGHPVAPVLTAPLTFAPDQTSLRRSGDADSSFGCCGSGMPLSSRTIITFGLPLRCSRMIFTKLLSSK